MNTLKRSFSKKKEGVSVDNLKLSRRDFSTESTKNVESHVVEVVSQEEASYITPSPEGESYIRDYYDKNSLNSSEVIMESIEEQRQEGNCSIKLDDIKCMLSKRLGDCNNELASFEKRAQDLMEMLGEYQIAYNNTKRTMGELRVAREKLKKMYDQCD